MGAKFIFLSLIASLTIVAGLDEEGPKVCIDDGCLIGLEHTSRLNRTFSSFLGIPYAKPPIGELRFKAPEKPEPWGTREAKEDGSMCITATYMYYDEDEPPSSEDCLYLNVYTPALPESGVRSPNLPVMVFIHPGTFMVWAGTTTYFQPQFFMDRDIVFVALNHRLNALGFLSTEDEVTPGNWGLKDQVRALQWVKDNIRAFGGDPDQVTLYGGSAGGASVHYHMLSPLSRGLFTKVIAQSGLANSRWAYSLRGQAREHAERLGQHFECPTDNSTVLVDCLREIPAQDLVDADPIFFEWFIDPMIKFPPVVEPNIKGAFLTGTPNDLFRSGQFADVPFLTGVSTKEGVSRSGAIMADEQLLQNFDVQRLKSFAYTLNFYQYPERHVMNIVNRINEFYSLHGNLTLEQEENIIQMFTDRYYVHPMVKAAEMQRRHQKSPIYLYYFEYIGQRGTEALAGRVSNTPLNGTGHLEEYMYLFPFDATFFRDDPWIRSSEDNDMIERMLDVLTNFATFGNPTPNSSGFTWKPVKSKNLEYLAIRGPNDLQMSSNLRQDVITFWDKLNVDRMQYLMRNKV